MGVAIFSGLIGLAVGSFLGVVSDRFDTAESLLLGRSHCNHCKEKLRWWELVPVLSYVFVRGVCPRCKKRIPGSYTALELVTAVAFVLLWQVVRADGWLLIVGEYLLLATFITLCFYDWQHQTFPASLLYVAITLGALVSLARVTLDRVPQVFVSDSFFAWLQSVQLPLGQWGLGALLGVLCLGAIAWPSRGLWMGYGDVFLVAALGFWVGYPFIIVTLLVAFYAGALVGVVMLLRRRVQRDHRLAFGPFLVLGGLVARVWGLPLFMSIMKLWGAS